jgi:NhaP-type Na+/H+ or K+/H+ antiporter
LAGIRDFAVEVAGGAALGAGLGYVFSRLTQRIDDPEVEITLTTILAYGSYLLAQSLHLSGVIATVAAGLMIGNFGMRTGMSWRTRIALWSFWEYASFLINSVLFLLIGLQVRREVCCTYGGRWFCRLLQFSWRGCLPYTGSFPSAISSRLKSPYDGNMSLRGETCEERVLWRWS